MQRLGAARQTVEEGLERCVRGDNPVVVAPVQSTQSRHGPPKGLVSQRLVKVHNQARKMESAPCETRGKTADDQRDHLR